MTDPPLIYLDHAASVPVRPEVRDAMAPYGAEVFGHASGQHRQARAARRALEDARERIGELLGAQPREVVFTSGGTEADNLAVFGVLGAASRRRPPRHGPPRRSVVVSSEIEHAAVLEPCRAAAVRLGGVEHRTAPVDAGGVIDLERLAAILDADCDGARDGGSAGAGDGDGAGDAARTRRGEGGADVVLVTVMLANNEVGTVQPLRDVVAITRRLAPGAVVHTDAVQAAAWVDVGEAAGGADLVSVSAHKLGGPKGAGALVVREGTELEALVLGGGQERERRAGTHDVAGAVGLAAALSAVAHEREDEGVRVAALRDRLADGLLDAVPSVTEAAPRKGVLPGHCHLCFEGVDREELVVLLDEAGVCVSAGAACASGALEPSHVLGAMGVPAQVARGSIRFSLGHTTTAQDVERALAVVPEAVARLRG